MFKSTLTVILVHFFFNNLLFSQHDTIKIDSLIHIGTQFSANSELDSSVNVFLQVKNLCLNNCAWDRYVRVNNELGILMQRKNLRDSSGYYFKCAFKKASHIWGEDDTRMAACFFNIGVLFDDKAPTLNNLDSALYYFKKSLRLWEKKHGKVHQLVARVCRRIAFNYQARIELKQSLDWFLKVTEIETVLYKNDEKRLSGNYGNIGLTYFNMGNYEKALEFLNKSLTIEQKYNPISKHAAACYNNLGLVYSNMGEFGKALEYQYKALEIRLKIFPENHEDVSASYNNLSSLYNSKCDYKRALECEYKALAIRRAVFGEEHFLTARSYNNIGLYYLETEEYKYAQEMQNRALEIRGKTLPYLNPEVAESYTNLGNIFERKKEFGKALEYHFKALDIAIKLYNSNHENIAIAHFNLAKVYQAMQKFDSAIWYSNQSAEFYRKTFGDHHPEYARCLNFNAETFLLGGDANKAMEWNNLAIKSVLNSNNIDTLPGLDVSEILFKPLFFDVLSIRASVLLRLAGEINQVAIRKEVWQLHKYLLKLSESIREGFDSEQSKLIFAKKAPALFSQAIDNCYTLARITGKPETIEEAYSFCQHLKAGVLFELINECNAKKFAGIPDTLLFIEKELNNRITSIENSLKKMISISNTDNDSINNVLFTLKEQYKNFQDSIEACFPKYFELKNPGLVPGITQLSGKLSTHEAILDYVLSDSVLFIFILTNNGVDLQKVTGVSKLPGTINSYLTAVNKIQIEPVTYYSDCLYNTLVSPILGFLKDKSKIYIIPDNELWYLPFEALYPKPKGSFADFTKVDYLLKRFEVTYHVSTPIWFLNTQMASYKPEYEYVGFAPVFDKHLSGNDTLNCIFYTDSIGNEIAVRAIGENSWRLNPLPFSKEEINQTRLLFSKKKKPNIVYYYKEANKANFLEIGSKCRILHVASHAIMDPAEPALSGIFFAPYQNGQFIGSKSQILYSDEIYNLNLKADLLVLSACQTGVGRLLRGEGIISLARGFMYAGTPNIIFSTWKIGDKNTKQLMVDFYKEYLGGLSYAGALRNAKLKMINSTGTAFPKYWAGMELIGN